MSTAVPPPDSSTKVTPPSSPKGGDETRRSSTSSFGEVSIPPSPGTERAPPGTYPVSHTIPVFTFLGFHAELTPENPFVGLLRVLGLIEDQDVSKGLKEEHRDFLGGLSRWVPSRTERTLDASQTKEIYLDLLNYLKGKDPEKVEELAEGEVIARKGGSGPSLAPSGTGKLEEPIYEEENLTASQDERAVLVSNLKQLTASQRETLLRISQAVKSGDGVRLSSDELQSLAGQATRLLDRTRANDLSHSLYRAVRNLLEGRISSAKVLTDLTESFEKVKTGLPYDFKVAFEDLDKFTTDIKEVKSYLAEHAHDTLDMFGSDEATKERLKQLPKALLPPGFGVEGSRSDSVYLGELKSKIYSEYKKQMQDENVEVYLRVKGFPVDKVNKDNILDYLTGGPWLQKDSPLTIKLSVEDLLDAWKKAFVSPDGDFSELSAIIQSIETDNDQLDLFKGSTEQVHADLKAEVESLSIRESSGKPEETPSEDKDLQVLVEKVDVALRGLDVPALTSAEKRIEDEMDLFIASLDAGTY